MNSLKTTTSCSIPSQIAHILKVTQYLSLYLLAIILSVAPAQADDFEDGLSAYDESNYIEAATAFQKSLEQNQSAAAHHNLALSLYQQGKPAEALWQLERAVRIAPTNQSYLYKLGALRQQLGLYKLPTTWWQSAANILPHSKWIWVAAVNFWLIIAGVLLPHMAGNRRPIALKLTISFATIAFALSTAAAVIQATQQASGIIISDEPALLHHAPASAAPEAGIARPGERARILDQHKQYLKIQTEANITGWVSAATFRKL